MTEENITRAFMACLLNVYKDDANFTHVPERELSCEATAAVLDLYARLCGLVEPDSRFREHIEKVIEAFRRQLVREHPGCTPIDEWRMQKLLCTDTKSKHRICVALCITQYRSITSFQLLAVSLVPTLAIAFAFVLLYRRIDKVLRTVRPNEQAPKQNDVALFTKVAVAVALAAVIIVYMPSDLSPRDLVVHLGFLTPYEARPLGVWQPSVEDLGRFQWHALDVDNVTRYPLIECAAYDNASALQEELLGALPDVLPSDALDPVLQRDRIKQRDEEKYLRKRAGERCVLAQQELLRLDATRMEHLIDRTAPSLSDIVRASAPPFSRVNDVLLARDGTRYYRVEVAVPNGTRVRIERRVVSEEHLLEGPRDWYRYFCANRAFNVFPCLCPAHLGYVNSGFYFHYPPTANEEAACDRPWRLWSKARHIRPLQGSKDVDSKMIYQPFPTAFPLNVNEKLNVTGVVHAEMTLVEFMEVADAFDSARGLALLSVREPEWIANEEVPLGPGTSPLLAVIPFDTLIGNEGLRAQTLSGDTNACFQYCLYLDEVILRQADVV